MQIRVKVVYFAQARDASGVREEVFSLPVRAPLRALLERVTSRHPALAEMTKSMQVAVNEEIADAGSRLEDGDVVALLPPVEGGLR